MSSSQTRVDSWLDESTKRLEAENIVTARLDCLVLLEDCTGMNRAWLLAHPEFRLDEEQLKLLDKQLRRRAKHEPLAYIRGKTEFYGREFIITKDVLEPRPESETMIDLLKALPLPASPGIVDVGSGSGALGITAKLELPASQVILVDIDKKALRVSETNVGKFNLDIGVRQSNLLDKLSNPIDVVMANLPYVPDSYQLNDAAMQEPRIAIFGGEDGLDIYRRLFKQLSAKDKRHGFVLTEALPFQHEELTRIAGSVGFKQIREEDFIQVFTPS